MSPAEFRKEVHWVPCLCLLNYSVCCWRTYKIFQSLLVYLFFCSKRLLIIPIFKTLFTWCHLTAKGVGAKEQTKKVQFVDLNAWRGSRQYRLSRDVYWLRARPKAERVFAEYENFLNLSDPTDRPDRPDQDAFQRLISFAPSYRLKNGFRHLKATFNKSFALA